MSIGPDPIGPDAIGAGAIDAEAIDSGRLADAVAAAEQTLGTNGRILVRSSGTEPVLRIMVEAETTEAAESIAAEVAAAITQ